MQISVRFPVYVSAAVLPRHKEPKRALAILSDEFEVREVEPDSYPVVATAAYGHADVHDFRFRGGVFYKRLNRYADQSLEKALIDHFWRLTFHRQAQLAAAFRPSEVIPRGVARAILQRGTITREIAQLMRVGRTMKLTGDGEAEVENARVNFRTMMNAVLSIDGEYWVASPEPMVSVDRIWERPMTLAVNQFTDVMMHRLPDTHSLGRWIYTLNQLGEARRWDHPSDRHPFTVKVFEPSLFSDEVPVGFSLSLLRYLSEQKEFPKALRRRLAEFVDSDTAWDWDDVSERIDCLLSNEAVTGRHRQLLEIEIERLDARMIVVPQIGAKAGFSRRPR